MSIPNYLLISFFINYHFRSIFELVALILWSAPCVVSKIYKNTCNSSAIVSESCPISCNLQVYVSSIAFKQINIACRYFMYDGLKHSCVEGNHIVNVFSFSKAHGMMGWRVGYVSTTSDVFIYFHWQHSLYDHLYETLDFSTSVIQLLHAQHVDNSDFPIVILVLIFFDVILLVIVQAMQHSIQSSRFSQLRKLYFSLG